MPFAVDSRKVATFALLAQAASWAVGVSAEHLQRGHLYKRTDASVKDDQCTDKPVFRPLVDPDTPKDKLTRKSYTHPSKTMTLVFSDEFEKEGRTFYPGDDQYWTAVDLNYWQTNDLEYYHPSAVTTKNGALEITLSEDARNGFNYTSGMIQSWNKMCFTGGLIEAKLSMPGTPKVPGFWPALWTMGNLGRAGYGATTEGTWPYSYDACDYGALESQTLNGKPEAIHQPGVGVPWASNMSLLPGQKLSRCTCPGAGVEHPGPFEYTSKTYVGRGAPELDILEGKPYADGVDGIIQSAQWGPFNWNYTLPSQDGIVLSDPTAIRSDVGGPYQQTVATLFKANQSCYERTGGCFAKYGMEYKPGFKDAYVTWVQNGHVSWTLPGSVLGPDSKAEISARPIPQEPMYLIANLALSQTWSTFDVANLTFPAKLRIDYIRVYQDPEHIAVTCDPVSFPTKDYIDNHTEAYTNPAHKQWKDAYPGKTFPPNKLLGQC